MYWLHYIVLALVKAFTISPYPGSAHLICYPYLQLGKISGWRLTSALHWAVCSRWLYFRRTLINMTISCNALGHPSENDSITHELPGGSADGTSGWSWSALRDSIRKRPALAIYLPSGLDILRCVCWVGPTGATQGASVKFRNELEDVLSFVWPGPWRCPGTSVGHSP